MPPVLVSAEAGRQRQLVQDAVGQEAGVGAVQRGGEPVGHAGQPGDDLVEVCQTAGQRSSLALCTVASKRRTCSPLV